MPSARFIAAALSPNSAECAVYLVTVDHADFPAPLRWCTGGEDVVSNGVTFTAVPMKVALPGEGADPGARRGRISVDNIDREIIGRLRTASSKPDAKIEIVLSGYPDDVELSYLGLEVIGQRPNRNATELEIAPRDDSVEVFPYQSFSPHRTPGLFD